MTAGRPLAVGVDLVEVDRIQRMLDRKADRVLAKLLTAAERQYCLEQAVPARHVAARVAAKEAVYKALQGAPEARAIGWQEIEVVRDWDGRPAVRLTGGAERRAGELGVHTVLISLTHSDLHAAAIALLVG